MSLETTQITMPYPASCDTTFISKPVACDMLHQKKISIDFDIDMDTRWQCILAYISGSLGLCLKSGSNCLSSLAPWTKV